MASHGCLPSIAAIFKDDVMLHTPSQRMMLCVMMQLSVRCYVASPVLLFGYIFYIWRSDGIGSVSFLLVMITT